MSIALSVCIKPSRTLACMVFFMCVLGNFVLAFLAYSVKALNSYWLALLSVCCLLSVFGLVRFCRKRISVSLDISEAGNVVLRMPTSRHGVPEVFSVRLIQSSTFWPMLLLLHFQPDVGPAIILHVLPDSVGQNAFRKLFVSLRWVSAHASRQYIMKSDGSSGNF